VGVDSMLRWRPLLALSAAAAAILTGCATSSEVANSPSSPITSLASYQALSLPPDAVRLAVATRDAHTLLDAAKVPPGAIETSASIPPATTSGDPNFVAVHHTYAVAALPSDPAIALLPKGAKATGWGSSNTGMTEVDFSYPNSKLLNGRTLLYTMQTTAHGYTVRIDAQVTWVSAKPLAAYVAPGASRVTVAFTSPLNERGPYRTHPVIGATVTSATAIRGITGVVDAMPAASLGVQMCADDNGATLTVVFWHSGAAHAFAKVVVDRTGCAEATITHFDAKGALTATGLASGWGVDKVIAHFAGMGNAPPAI
jgi:hypothetical protein